MNGNDKHTATTTVAAQEAVWELAKKVRTELDRASCPDAFMRIAVEAVMGHAAAPVAAAPVDLTNWASHYSINPAAIEALQSMLASTPAAPKEDNDAIERAAKALHANGADSMTSDTPWSELHDGEVNQFRSWARAALVAANPKGVSMSDCPIIRLAPGEYTDWEKRVWRRGVIECATQSDIAAAMQATSPKGGIEPVATLTIGEAGEEGTQPYFLDRIRETEAFGNLKPGTYQLAVCSMQATSAEVGV